MPLLHTFYVHYFDPINSHSEQQKDTEYSVSAMIARSLTVSIKMLLPMAIAKKLISIEFLYFQTSNITIIIVPKICFAETIDAIKFYLTL